MRARRSHASATKQLLSGAALHTFIWQGRVEFVGVATGRSSRDGIAGGPTSCFSCIDFVGVAAGLSSHDGKCGGLTSCLSCIIGWLTTATCVETFLAGVLGSTFSGTLADAMCVGTRGEAHLFGAPPGATERRAAGDAGRRAAPGCRGGATGTRGVCGATDDALGCVLAASGQGAGLGVRFLAGLERRRSATKAAADPAGGFPCKDATTVASAAASRGLKGSFLGVAARRPPTFA